MVSDLGVLTSDYTQVGNYHTHADYSTKEGVRTTKENDYFGSDNLSNDDKTNADGRLIRIPGYEGTYVATPSGVFYVYIPKDRTTERLRDDDRQYGEDAMNAVFQSNIDNPPSAYTGDTDTNNSAIGSWGGGGE